MPYNCTVSPVTGFSPYFLMFGRIPKLPLDIDLGIPTMEQGQARHLCYALNATRRRRQNGEEERRPGVMPLLGRGIRPVVPQFQHWDRVPGGNNYNYNYSARGRSRSFPAPLPYLQIRRQPHSLPCCLAAGFGHVTPNAQFPQD